MLYKKSCFVINSYYLYYYCDYDLRSEQNSIFYSYCHQVAKYIGSCAIRSKSKKDSLSMPKRQQMINITKQSSNIKSSSRNLKIQFDKEYVFFY